MGTQDILLIVLPAVWSTLLLAITFLLYRQLRFMVAAWFALRSFVQAPDDGSPSPVVQIAASVANQVARHAGASAMGQASGEARAQTAAEADLIRSGIRLANPAATVLLDQLFGASKWPKMFAKNPHYLAAAQSLLGEGGFLSGLLSKKTVANDDVNGPGIQARLFENG